MDAYEVLISAALIGDTSHFAREDEVEAAWAIVDPILKSGDTPCRVPEIQLGPAAGRGPHQGPLRLAQPRGQAAGLDAFVRPWRSGMNPGRALRPKSTWGLLPRSRKVEAVRFPCSAASGGTLRQLARGYAGA